MHASSINTVAVRVRVSVYGCMEIAVLLNAGSVVFFFFTHHTSITSIESFSTSLRTKTRRPATTYTLISADAATRIKNQYAVHTS